MVTINKIKDEFSKNLTFTRKKQNLPWLNEQLWKYETEGPCFKNSA